MKTKYTLLVIISWFFTVSLLAQTVNESVVVSSGGGPSAGGIYSNFAVVGEPFVASPVAGSTISTNIGFIYRTADIQATIVNLTIFLEGLYAGSGVMNKAQNEFGDQFSGTVADKITFELHNAITYATTAYTNSNVDLNTNGTATVSVPSGVSGSYYVTVKHRNSIETVSKNPINFAGTPLSYNFSTDFTQAFGDNLKHLGEGIYGLYAGDINGDGAVDALDMIPLENDAAGFVTGYINTDVNGDGSIDALDMILVDNNSAAFISAITP
jgi:hypothetical protein